MNLNLNELYFPLALLKENCSCSNVAFIKCSIIQRTNNKCLLVHNSETSNSFYMPGRIFFEVIFPKYVDECLLLHK